MNEPMSPEAWTEMVARIRDDVPKAVTDLARDFYAMRVGMDRAEYRRYRRKVVAAKKQAEVVQAEAQSIPTHANSTKAASMMLVVAALNLADQIAREANRT